MTIAPFTYLNEQGHFLEGTPAGYTCGPCGKTGVRLYRLPHGASCHKTGFELWCFRCAFFRKPMTYGGWDESLNNTMAAVPTEDGSTFWGISSVPRNAWDWWRLLPMITPDMMVDIGRSKT